MDFVMTKEKWDGLSDKDKQFMKSLGLEYKDVVKKEVKKATKNPITLERLRSTKTTCPEEEYWVKITKVCGCCGTEELVTGKMAQVKPTDKHLGLVKQSIPKGEPFRQRRYVAIDCIYCIEVLGGKDSVELAKIIIGLHQRDARRLVL